MPKFGNNIETNTTGLPQWGNFLKGFSGLITNKKGKDTMHFTLLFLYLQ